MAPTGGHYSDVVASLSSPRAAAAVALLLILCQTWCDAEDKICGDGQSNYTLTIVINKTALTTVKMIHSVRTQTCFAFSWFFCKTKYKLQTYTMMVEGTVPHNITKQECCPGYSKTGHTCNKTDDCKTGRYGENCTLNCSCPENAFDACDNISGNCTCLPRYKGDNCTDKCDDDACGMCICDNGGTCPSDNGNCECEPGWEGQFCENSCSNNTYGKNCSNTCTCNETQICEPIDGNCTLCQPGWSNPPVCEEACPDWTYGLSCMYNCTCNMENTDNCSNVDGRCTCKPGYNGSFCENKCPIGTYGADCVSNCTNCTSGLCDHVNGSCQCYGNMGENCTDECPQGYFGVDCGTNCSCNLSHSNGTCDPCSGVCECYPGWTGTACNIECPAYLDTCQSINVSHACDHQRADWQCTKGWTGELCSKACPSTHFGPNCSSECNCTDEFDCHAITGECICPPGRTGHNCSEECPQGMFGFNCSSNCSCSELCNASTGECYCTPGYTGEECKEVCPPHMHGPNCSLNCNCTDSNLCHPVNGSCHCPKGWDGDICAEQVPFIDPNDPTKTYIYIIAAVGAALVVLLVLLIFMWVWRRGQSRASEKKADDFEMEAIRHSVENNLYAPEKVRASVTEVENGILMNSQNSIDATEGRINEVQESPADTIQTADVKKDGVPSDNDDDYAHDDVQMERKSDDAEKEHVYEIDPGGVTHVNDGNDDEQDDDYYADVADEVKPKTAENVRVSRDVAEDVDEEMYDRCDSHNGPSQPDTGNTYDTFEEIRKREHPQDEDYDVVDKPGTSTCTKKRKYIENYNTFAEFRQLSKQSEHSFDAGDQRSSDSYDNVGFSARNEEQTKIVTDIYNTTDKAASKTSDNGSREGLRAVEPTHMYENSGFEKGLNKRVSEEMYEELPNADDSKAEANRKQKAEAANLADSTESDKEKKPRQRLESYENVDLPLQTENVDKKSNITGSRESSLKSKDRKATDYEQFRLKVKPT